jgi:hypothetical protein
LQLLLNFYLESVLKMLSPGTNKYLLQNISSEITFVRLSFLFLTRVSAWTFVFPADLDECLPASTINLLTGLSYRHIWLQDYNDLNKNANETHMRRRRCFN